MMHGQRNIKLWIQVLQDRIHWRILMKTRVISRVLWKAGNFLI